MSLTKETICQDICDKHIVLRKTTAKKLVDSVFDIIKATLTKGESVKIYGFGNFVVREKNPRRGRNPQTGKKMIISGRKVVTFKTNVALKKVLNPDRREAT